MWLWLLLGQGFFWRTDVSGCRPADARSPALRWPSVAVVVPARDEAAVLPVSLPSLLAQDYPGRAEVFLVDDGSTDGTGELARRLAERHGGLPLTVDSPGEPRPGWTGKLWAVRHGIGAGHARADAGVPAADGRGHRARAGQPAGAGRRGGARARRLRRWCRRWPGCGWRPAGSG